MLSIIPTSLIVTLTKCKGDTVKCTTIILLCGCNAVRLHTFQGGYNRAAAGIIKQEEGQRGDEADSAGVWPCIRGSNAVDTGEALIGCSKKIGPSHINGGRDGWSSPHCLHSHIIDYMIF